MTPYMKIAQVNAALFKGILTGDYSEANALFGPKPVEKPTRETVEAMSDEQVNALLNDPVVLDGVLFAVERDPERN